MKKAKRHGLAIFRQLLICLTGLPVIACLCSGCMQEKRNIEKDFIKEINPSFTLEEKGFFYKEFNSGNYPFLTYWYDFESGKKQSIAVKPAAVIIRRTALPYRLELRRYFFMEISCIIRLRSLRLIVME